jgi:D-alanyl-lipoteichoic acid acyltransferase DltB (MBOAT superfamily)
MLFNSIHFLLFFQIVVAAYFSMPHRFRWALLLLSSCYFYMVFIPKYILILFALILIDYGAGLAIEASNGSRRKAILVLSLVANVGMLAFFKYFNFVSENMAALFAALHWSRPLPLLSVALPIGLSFHTFQSMAYTIEVYLGNAKAERHLGIYALYVLFYPQLVAGPIERPRLLAQFHAEHAFDDARVLSGLKLMLWGFIKKVVIADRLTLLVDHVFAAPGSQNGAALALATYFFAFQIYCDFSGYSDIALGAAEVMGFNLMRNFERPYHAQTIAEFWKRWHISLSTWFRDYLYIPLGGSRVSTGRWLLNLTIVFLVSGLWHGANWTFIVWGGLHGFYMIFSHWTKDLRARMAHLSGLADYPRLHRGLRVLITFHLATFAWIAFRARSVSDFAVVVVRILDFASWRMPRNVGLSGRELTIALASIVALEAVHWAQRENRLRESLAAKPAWVRWPAYAAALFALCAFGEFHAQSFIYFQF